MNHTPRGPLFFLALGVLCGGLSTAGVLYAQQRQSPVAAEAGAPFDLVDTPGSTFLLNRHSGEVWRLGFTEVRGERHWFGTFVPLQPGLTFEAFQQRLRRQIGEE
ncbi:MAG: hypothetical protein ACO3JL_11220 [Myxococcota bacterium]